MKVCEVEGRNKHSIPPPLSYNATLAPALPAALREKSCVPVLLTENTLGLFVVLVAVVVLVVEQLPAVLPGLGAAQGSQNLTIMIYMIYNFL